MAESHKRCERCKKNLAWFQILPERRGAAPDPNAPYAALCCDCLSPSEKAAIDRGRALEREAQLGEPALVGEGEAI
jgi:hypothetical protein